MPNPKVSLLFVCAGAALALPATASGQIDPGVNYDPGSPAGKEYAIPLAEGRADGAGTTDQQKGADIPFGAGIKPPGGNGDGSGGGNGGAHEGHAGGKDPAQGNGAGSGAGSRGQAQVPGARAGESSQALAARIARAEQPQGTAAPTLLLALAVLGPAALLTLVLMRRAQISRTGRTA
jgi:hypothetical protein